MINTTDNTMLAELTVAAVALSDARKMVSTQHYMKTWPQGASVAYGLFYRGACYGVMVLGRTHTTRRKVMRHCASLEEQRYIELQRTWVSDVMGHNTESWMMARVMRCLKDRGVWVVITHSGGCKDDVGYIFQASGWLYFGAEPCSDFFQTKSGAYKSIIAGMKYGRVPKDVIKRGKQSVGEYLFGRGTIIEARRHFYLYPIRKSVRRRLRKLSHPFPKDPKDYRYNQAWTPKDIQQEVGARGVDG